MAEFPNDFELIPADSDPTTIDEELADLIDPAEVLDLDTDDDDFPIGRGILIDYDTGTAGRRPQWVYERDAVVAVAQVALRTRRGKHAIFDESFGMDDPDALIGFSNDDPERQADYERDVTETLLACHERITQVGDFLYLTDEDDDVIVIDMSIEIDGDEEVRLEGIPVSASA